MKSNCLVLYEKTWFQVVLLGAVVLATYLPTVGFSFVYDDHWTIQNNLALDHVRPLLRFFLDATTAANPASGISGDVYRPLSTLSFAINKAVLNSPGAFHFVNVFIHAINVLLLWLLLRRKAAAFPALAASLLFAIHPVQIESVAWVTQRSVLICASGCLLALYCWEESRQRPRFAWLACLFLIFALLGKETALGLPLLFLAQTDGRRDARLAALVAGFAIAVGYLLLRSAVVGSWGQPVQYEHGHFSSCFDGMMALAHYFRTLVWPVGLNVSYRAPESAGFSNAGVWLGLFFLLGLIFSAWYFRSRNRLLFSGIVIFLVFWLPHSGVLPLVTFAADRFLYLPMIGVAWVVVAVWSVGSPPRAGVVVILSLCFCLAVQRTADWHDDQTLWAASVKADPENSFALASYGAALEKTDVTAAESFYKQALSHRPNIGLARSVLTRLIYISRQRGDLAAVSFWEGKLATVPR